jgi:ketosteroid isomerase-like protein
MKDSKGRVRSYTMKTRLLPLVGLAIGFALPTFAQDQNTISPEVRQQIEAIFQKFQDAFNNRDAAAIAGLRTQDAIEVRSWTEDVFSGRQAIEQMFGAGDFVNNPGKVGLAISFALPTFAQQEEAAKLHDILSKKYNEAVNNHDAAAIGALYTDDAIFVTDTGPLYGRQAIEKILRRPVQGVATQKPYQHDRSAFWPHVGDRQFHASWSLEPDW